MELVYSPDKPLSCGAKVWIETRGDITVDGKILSASASSTIGKDDVVSITRLATNLDKSLKEFLSKKRKKVVKKLVLKLRCSPLCYRTLTCITYR